MCCLSRLGYLVAEEASVSAVASSRLLTMLTEVRPRARLTLGPDSRASSWDTSCSTWEELSEETSRVRARSLSASSSALLAAVVVRGTTWRREGERRGGERRERRGGEERGRRRERDRGGGERGREMERGQEERRGRVEREMR